MANTNPDELSFWRERLLDRTLLKVVEIYPDRAKVVFGDGPVKRKNLIEMGMVLGAREILATPTEQVFVGCDDVLDNELCGEIDKLQDEQKALAINFLSAKNQVQIARELARKIISDATGVEPPP